MRLPRLGVLALTLVPQVASAVTSGELYTGAAYGYGRYEARVKYAAGDGVISSFFMWKDGSEQTGTFWNELDFEKVGADCHVETNPIYGNPPANHGQKHTLDAKPCDEFHVYTFEWTPEAIVWLVDGAEIRRETGATAQAFVENASGGMQVHFNVWPGDASFGGNFSPSILPIHQYVDWIKFSAYADGAFQLSWREDFDGPGVPSNWLTGNWGSPKNLSTHDPRNVNFLGGCAVLSLTADDATGTAGAVPCTSGGGQNQGGMASGGGATMAGAPGAGTGAQTGGNLGSGGTTSSGGAGQPTTQGGATMSPTGSSAGTSTSAAGDNGQAGSTPLAPTSQSSSSSGCTLGARDEAPPLLTVLGLLASAAVIRRKRWLSTRG